MARRKIDDATANGPPEGWSSTSEPTEAPPPDYRPPRSFRVHRIDGSVDTFALDADLDYRLGRGSDNDLSFEKDETVSRVHGLLWCDPLGTWRYADQRSRNGSVVLERERFERSGYGVGTFLKPYEHVAVGAGEVICLAKGRSRLELSDEPARPELASGAKWPSEAGRRLEKELARAARSDASVFLLGPSGSGKTFVAGQIHASSKRRSSSFVSLNCGRLPRDTAALVSLLLGHLAGAYTGAAGARTGELVEAHGGTVFLDEVESMPPEAQVFFLDVVEEGSALRPLGASPKSKPLELDLRFIAASKKPLAESGLRHDLCERLSTLSIEIPHLEDRRADIPALVARLMKDDTLWPEDVRPSISDEALGYLGERDYPGQIRELRAALQVTGNDALADAEEQGRPSKKAVIEADALEAYFEKRNRAHHQRNRTVVDLRPVTEAELAARKRPMDVTREELAAALERAKGNQTHAAAALGMSLNTLKTKMRVLGLKKEDFAS